MKNYKPVLKFQEILSLDIHKKEKLFKIWDFLRNLESDVPGCRIAEDMARKWEFENFGQTNEFKYEKFFKQTYNFFFQEFKQVEERKEERYGDLKEIITYIGFHRCPEFLKAYNSFMRKFDYNFKTWGDSYKQDPDEKIFQKRYASLKTLGIEKEYKKLIKLFNKQLKDFSKWQKETKLPYLRYFGGLVKDITLREFEIRKSNLEYILINGHHVAIENIEHFEGLTNECHHGIGRLLSVDRRVIIEGKIYRVSSFRTGYLIDILKDYIKIKPVKVPYFLKPVQLEEHFEVSKHSELHGGIMYRREILGMIYDFCFLKDGITYHSENPTKALEGWWKKKEQIDFRAIAKENGDEIVSFDSLKKCAELSKYDIHILESFFKKLGINKKVKYLLSDLRNRTSEQKLLDHPIFEWERIRDKFPEVRNKRQKEAEVKEKERRERIKSNLSRSWNIQAAHNEFGFCETGLKAFCILNGIDPECNITGEEVLQKVKMNFRENYSRFSSELRTFFGELS